MTSRTFSSRCLRLSVISVLAASILILSSCSHGENPKNGSSGGTAPSASATYTPSPTATPTPTPVYKPADTKGKAQNVPVPVKPALAGKNSKEGVEAFTKYWFQVLSYAYETGNTALMESVSGPDCRFCNGLRDVLKTAWQGNNWIVGGKIQTSSLKAKFSLGNKSQQATVQVIQQEIAIYKAKETLHQSVTKASNSASQAVLSFDSTGWTIIDLGLIR